MDLLIVSQFFWPENFRINDLAWEMAERGHSVTVLTGKPNYPEGVIFSKFLENPLAFDRLGRVRIVRTPIFARRQSRLSLVLSYLSFVVSATTVGTWRLRDQRFDTILVHQTSPITVAIPGLFLRWLKHAPMFMWVLDPWPETLLDLGLRSPPLIWFCEVLVRFIYRRCDRVLVQSRAFFPLVAAHLGHNTTIRYFPCWPEKIFTDRATFKEQFVLPQPETFRIVFAGNVGTLQGLFAMLDAAELLREQPLRWFIVGAGRAIQSLRSEIVSRRLVENVLLLGRHPLEAMPSLFAQADALLVSLRSGPVWDKTIPGKVQSYLASGRPVLAMLNGEGARVIVESGAGLVGPAEDGNALARNVQKLMSLPANERVAMGLAGQLYCAREFHRDTQISFLEGWIKEVADSDA